MISIHKTAIVQEGAIIGEGTQIGAYAYIGSDVKIGNNVKIYQGAQIHGACEIGDNCSIFSYAILGTPPQDSSYKDEKTKLIIGKNNIIREYVSINRGTLKGGGVTQIGDDNFLMAYTHVAHDCKLGNNIIMANNATLAGHTHIEDFVVIGGMTPIHQFVTIGEGAMIGGASAVSQDIPPFCLAEGNRAVVKSLNSVGIARRFDKVDIDALKKAFKKLFRTTAPIKDSASELLSSSTNAKVHQLCQFILQTKRGIPRMRRY